MGDLRMIVRVLQSSGSSQPRSPEAGQRGNRSLTGRRVLLALLSAAVLVGLVAQPGAAVNVPQAVVVSSNPAEWTPHVLDGKVAAIVQVGNKLIAGGQFTQVASAAAPTTAIPRSNIFAFDATTGAIDTAFAPVLDAQVESLAVAPDGLHVFAGGSFTKINGVAQKNLVKLRLSDGARITAFKGKTSARVKDMAVSGGRLYIGGTFRTVNGVARTAFAALDPINGLPLSWNPGRDRGVGAFALVATDKGLWIGSDTDASVATSTTPAPPSCPWRAAPRSPSPGSAPCPATCSASAPTAP